MKRLLASALLTVGLTLGSLSPLAGLSAQADDADDVEALNHPPGTVTASLWYNRNTDRFALSGVARDFLYTGEYRPAHRVDYWLYGYTGYGARTLLYHTARTCFNTTSCGLSPAVPYPESRLHNYAYYQLQVTAAKQHRTGGQWRTYSKTNYSTWYH